MRFVPPTPGSERSAGSGSGADSNAGSNAGSGADSNAGSGADSSGSGLLASDLPQLGQKAWPSRTGDLQFGQLVDSTKRKPPLICPRHSQPRNTEVSRGDPLSQWPDVAGVVSDSPSRDSDVLPAAPEVASATSPVMAALLQAEATPASVEAATQASPSASAASKKRTGLTSRVVLSWPMPRLIAIGCSILAATRHQSKANAIIAMPAAMASALAR